MISADKWSGSDRIIINNSSSVITPCVLGVDIASVRPSHKDRLPTQLLPLYGSKVTAGFPSPAEDYIEGMLDLNTYLIKHPAATFFVRVRGDSMSQAGIFPNDLLIVDRSITANYGNIVIAIVEGELIVKRLARRQGKLFLDSENPTYKPIAVKGELQIWGVVTNVIHAV